MNAFREKTKQTKNQNLSSIRLFKSYTENSKTREMSSKCWWKLISSQTTNQNKTGFFFSLKRFKSLKFTSCAPFLKKQPDNIFQPNKRLNKPNRRQKGNQYKQVAGRGGKGGGGAGDPLYEEGRSFRIVTVHKSLDQSKENDSSEVSSPHSNSSTRKRQN